MFTASRHRPPQSSASVGEPTALTGWQLRCPWCHGWLPPYWFVTSASMRLARHAMAAHPFELSLFEVGLVHWRKRVDELEWSA